MSSSSGLRVLERDRPRLERHPADGARARASPHDLGMHRAGPVRAGRRRCGRRLERHAALRTGAGPDLSHLGVHRARVLAGVGSGRRWTSGYRRCGADEGLGVRRELLLARRAAEVVGPAAVILLTDGIGGEDLHAADRVDDVLGGARGGNGHRCPFGSRDRRWPARCRATSRIASGWRRTSPCTQRSRSSRSAPDTHWCLLPLHGHATHGSLHATTGHVTRRRRDLPHPFPHRRVRVCRMCRPLLAEDSRRGTFFSQLSTTGQESI